MEKTVYERVSELEVTVHGLNVKFKMFEEDLVRLKKEEDKREAGRKAAARARKGKKRGF